MQEVLENTLVRLRKLWIMEPGQSGAREPKEWIEAIEQVLVAVPKVLWSGEADLQDGMLMGYMYKDKRIDAPDQQVEVIVLAKKGMKNEPN